MSVLKSGNARDIKIMFTFFDLSCVVLCRMFQGLIVDQSIDMLSFCGPVRLHDRGFSFICLNVAALKWMCYCFIAKESVSKCSGGQTRRISRRVLINLKGTSVTRHSTRNIGASLVSGLAASL